MNKAVRILIVDDLELYRHGLRHMLEPEEDMDVVGDCDAEEASSKIARLYPDMVLTCIQMPGLKGIIRNSLDYGGDVIVLAESFDYRAEALEAGAASYLLKDVIPVELAQAIRQVYRDRPLVAVELVIPPPDNAAQLLRFMCQLEEILRDNFVIVWAVVSRDRDTVITIQPRSTTRDDLSSLLIKLANMPEVDKVEELAGAFPSFPKRFGFLLKLGISPSKRLRVTLKETGTTRIAQQGGTQANS